MSKKTDTSKRVFVSNYLLDDKLISVGTRYDKKLHGGSKKLPLSQIKS